MRTYFNEERKHTPSPIKNKTVNTREFIVQICFYILYTCACFYILCIYVQTTSLQFQMVTVTLGVNLNDQRRMAI